MSGGNDLESRELQPLRDHLQDLGADARPAIEEWAARHGFELRLVVTAEFRLPGDFRQNPVPFPLPLPLPPAIGSTHILPQGLEPEPLRELLGVDVMVSEYLPPGTALMVNGRRLVAPDVLSALRSRVG